MVVDKKKENKRIRRRKKEKTNKEKREKRKREKNRREKRKRKKGRGRRNHELSSSSFHLIFFIFFTKQGGFLGKVSFGGKMHVLGN